MTRYKQLMLQLATMSDPHKFTVGYCDVTRNKQLLLHHVTCVPCDPYISYDYVKVINIIDNCYS